MTAKSAFPSLLALVHNEVARSPNLIETLMLQAYVGQQNAVDTLFSRATASSEQAPASGSTWGEDREVRAELISFLCTSKKALAFADPQGILLCGAKITGVLDLADTNILFPLTIQNCYFENQPRFFQSEIRGLDLAGSFAPGLEATLITVKGYVSLKRFKSEGGSVRLGSSQISGDLDCSGGSFSNLNRSGLDERAETFAFDVNEATINGSVFLRKDFGDQAFSSVGLVSLLGTRIQGDLDCGGGNFVYAPTPKSPEAGVTLDAERAVIKGAVFLNDSFTSTGEVCFVDAQIGASLFCDDGHFENKSLKLPATDTRRGAAALQFERASVVGTARFAGVTVVGRIALVDTRIGGALLLDDSDMRLAQLDLSGASAAGYSDRCHSKGWPPQSWPLQDNLYLKRFVYSAILDGFEDAEKRLKWLALQPTGKRYHDFNSESYAQLATVLTQSGDDDGARLVLEEMKRLQRQQDHPYWHLNPFYWLWDAIGQGYYPSFALGYGITLILLGWVIYRRSYLAGTLVPTDKDAYQELDSKGTIPPHYTRLSSLMMSVETSIPLVKLGQADKWQPGSLHRPISGAAHTPGQVQADNEVAADNEQEAARYRRTDMFNSVRRLLYRLKMQAGLEPDSAGSSINSPLSRRWTSAESVRRFMWLQILFGWLFATLLVYSVADWIRK